MRLWHYKLIPLLPKEMLVSQWRECIAIKRQWEKGTLKHRLVSYVMNYSKETFISYVNIVVSEMRKRGIKYQQSYYNELRDFCVDAKSAYMYYPEHNDRYLRQCYFNLQEKYDRNIITGEEWNLIQNNFQNKIN